jgi:hypothetical protein
LFFLYIFDRVEAAPLANKEKFPFLFPTPICKFKSLFLSLERILYLSGNGSKLTPCQPFK